MTAKEFEQLDKDSLMNKVKDILTKAGGSDSLILSLVPLNEPNGAIGTFCEIPSPTSLYAIMKLITRLFIIDDCKDILFVMVHGIMDGMRYELGIPLNESDEITKEDADKIVQDYITKNFGKDKLKS